MSWDYLNNLIKHHRIPQALLLNDLDLAQRFANVLITQSTTDLIQLTPETKIISVEQVRECVTQVMKGSQGPEQWQVILIHPAESLHRASANALLKILEEPPKNTCFLLVTTAPHKLPTTVLSRCQRVPHIRLDPVSPAPEVSQILQACLLGKRDPIASARELKDSNIEEILTQLQLALKPFINGPRDFALWDKLLDLKAACQRSNNLNTGLVLDDFFSLAYGALTDGPGRE